MHYTAYAKHVGVHFGYNKAPYGFPSVFHSIAGLGKLSLQWFPQYGEHRMQDRSEQKTMPRWKVVLLQVHVAPGSSPVGDRQRTYHKQRHHRITEVQYPFLAGVSLFTVMVMQIHKYHRIIPWNFSHFAVATVSTTHFAARTNQTPLNQILLRRAVHYH